MLRVLLMLLCAGCAHSQVTAHFRTYKQDDYKNDFHTIGKDAELMTTDAHELAMMTSVPNQSAMRTSEPYESGLMTSESSESGMVTSDAKQSETITTDANESRIMMTTDANESRIMMTTDANESRIMMTTDANESRIMMTTDANESRILIITDDNKSKIMMTTDAYAYGVTSNNTRDTTNLSVPRTWTMDMYIQMSISILGITGNMFSLPVLYRKNLQKLPCIFYLKVLTWADIVYLFSRNLAGLHPLTNYFNTLHSLACKAGNGLTTAAMFFPKYTVLGISMERFIAICFPLKGRHLLQSRNSKIYLTFVMIMLSISFTIAAILSDNIPQENLNNTFGDDIMCVLQRDTYPILNSVLFITIFVHNHVPGLVILICNVTMLVKVTYSRLTRRNLTTSSSVTQKKENAMTALLVTIGVSYLILTLPNALLVFVLGREVMRQYPPPLAFTITKSLYNFNYAVDAFVYVAAGSIIRKEILLMFYEMFAFLQRCRR